MCPHIKAKTLNNDIESDVLEEEATVPVCGRKAMAAAGWLAALLCCG